MSDRIGVALTPMETRREVIVETALLAESLGYEIFRSRPFRSSGDRVPRPRRHWPTVDDDRNQIG